jgi:hypothetical protein
MSIRKRIIIIVVVNIVVMAVVFVVRRILGLGYDFRQTT